MFKVISVYLALLTLAFSQELRWVYTHNGPGNQDDEAWSIIYGADGNIYLAGKVHVGRHGQERDYDFTVISLTRNGQQRWIYTYNGSGNEWDDAFSIVYGVDGNLYAAGMSYNGTEFDFIVISLTTGGSQRWVYQYNGPGTSGAVAHSIVYGTDGNIYAAGKVDARSGAWASFGVISLTRNGAQRWVYSYHSDRTCAGAYSIVYGTDGNIYAAGYCDYQVTGYDFAVISLTTDGNERWVYRYNGPINGSDAALSIAYGADGNIYTAGHSAVGYRGIRAVYDFAVVSLDRNGSQRWVHRYNGPGNYQDFATSIVYGLDRNIYVAGKSWTDDLKKFAFTVVSLTPTGGERWVYRYDGPANGNDEATSIVCGWDGNIYAAGMSYGGDTRNDLIVVSLTTTGIQRWLFRYNGPANNHDWANSLAYGGMAIYMQQELLTVAEGITI